MVSVNPQIMKIGTIVKLVNLTRRKAVGIAIVQTNTLSKRKVINVLPPERKVK
jgi:hypothetical protein